MKNSIRRLRSSNMRSSQSWCAHSCRCFGLGIALAMAVAATHAAAAPDPFSRAFYSKYPAANEIIKREPGKGEPPTRAELAHLDAFLDRMRGARDRLQNQCIGSQSSRMVRTFGGQTILVLPDLFAKCEDDAKALASGGSVHDQTVIPGLMRSFNAYWNADYLPPKPDPVDLKAWRDKANSMTRFDPPVCNGVAGMIIDALAEGGRTKAREIFDKYLPLCGSGSTWAKMFEPSLPKLSPAASSTDRLSRDFYPLYPRTTGEWAAVPGKGAPPPVSGMKAFEDHLANMRAIRDRFRQDCIGSGSAQMVKQVRGVTVLSWPERFEACESDARKLFEPMGLFDSNMAMVWNPYWGANYSPPRGDPADEEGWRRWKNGFTRFPKECEIASWRIIHSGEPGFPESAEQVFKRMEKRCPARWIALFEPEELIKKRELDAKKRCKPGTSYIVVDEKSGNGSREECDESDKFIPPDSARDGRPQKKDQLAEELAAIQRGEFERPAGTGEFASSTQAMLNARRQAGADLTAAMENGVRQQPKAGSIGGIQIFGGENGQLLEAVAAQANLSNTAGEGSNVGTTNSCDDAAERRSTENMQTSRVGTIRSLPPAQQECATAKLYVDIYARALAYAQRCNRRAEMPSIQGALQQSRGEASRICSSVNPSRPAQTAAPIQLPRSVAPPSKSSIAAPANPSGRNRCATSLPC